VTSATSRENDQSNSLPVDSMGDSSWSLFPLTPAYLPVGSDAEQTVVQHHEAMLQFDKADKIGLWLFSAFTVLPSAHHELRSQLLALGAAQDAESFAKIREGCSVKLSFAAARPKQDPRAFLLAEVSDAEEQVRDVVEWANGVRDNGDSMLVVDTVALAGAALDVVESVLEKEKKMSEFLLCKARCIGIACTWGTI
jgi:hypothetical protein